MHLGAVGLEVHGGPLCPGSKSFACFGVLELWHQGVPPAKRAVFIAGSLDRFFFGRWTCRRGVFLDGSCSPQRGTLGWRVQLAGVGSTSAGWTSFGGAQRCSHIAASDNATTFIPGRHYHALMLLTSQLDALWYLPQYVTCMVVLTCISTCVAAEADTSNVTGVGNFMVLLGVLHFANTARFERERDRVETGPLLVLPRHTRKGAKCIASAALWS